MTTLYVVTYQIGGFAKEDAPTTVVSGVYTDKQRAHIDRSIVHGIVTEMTLDLMKPGILADAKAFGLIK